MIATGVSAASPGRLLPAIVLISAAPLLLAGRAVPRVTRTVFVMLAGLVVWYWVMLVAGFSSDGFRYTAQLTLLAAATVPIVVILGKAEHLVRVLSAQVLAGALGATYLLFGGGAKYSGATVRLTYEALGINSISIMLGVSAVTGIALFHLLRSPVARMVLLSAILLLIFAILRTGTRSVIFGLPLAVGVAYTLGAKEKRLRYWGAGLLLLGLLIAVIASTVASGWVEGRLAQRIFSIMYNPEEVLANSRFVFWRDALEWYAAHPVGTGPGSALELRALASHDREAHNTFVSTLLQVNVVGLLFLLAGVATLGVCALRVPSERIRIAALMVFFFFILQINKGSMLQTRLFWYPLALSAVMIEAGGTRRTKRLIGKLAVLAAREPEEQT